MFHKLGNRQTDKRIILETISISHYVEKVCHVKIILKTSSKFVTKESSWKLFDSLTFWKGFVTRRSSWKLSHYFNVWTKVGIPPFWVIFTDNPKSRFVGQWTTWTSHTRRRKTLAFLASSHLADLFLSWRWTKSKNLEQLTCRTTCNSMK